MSGTALTTIIIVLAEILLVVLALGAFLLLRAKKKRKLQPPPAQADKKPAQEKQQNEPSLLAYIENEIALTTARLEQANTAEDATQQASLGARLKLLEAEKQVITSRPSGEADAGYWKLINQYYETQVTETSGGDRGKRDAIYRTRIKNLESFKAMFIDSQDKLKNSFDTINDLKNALGNLSSSDEATQLEDMVDTLSIDNINLNKQLNDAQQQLTKLLQELTEQREKTDAVEEEASQAAADADKRDNFNRERINNLENFRTMFIDSQEKLKNSFDTISDLKNALGNLPETTEASQLEDMVDKLSVDNINLNKQLNEANQKLVVLMEELDEQRSQSNTSDDSQDTHTNEDEIKALRADNDDLNKQLVDANQRLQTMLSDREQDDSENVTVDSELDGMNEEMGLLKEENEFLTTQIEHLLKQEAENSDVMKAQMERLEAALKEREEEAIAREQSDPQTQENDSEITEKVHSLEEENEFLCSQIEHLLKQEVAKTEEMKARLAELEQSLSEAQGDTGTEQDEKIHAVVEENEFLCAQIEHLLKQEVEKTAEMEAKLEQLEDALKEKENESNTVPASKDAADGDEKITEKLQAIEEENEFLCSQIQHLLQQELESGELIKSQVQQLETALAEKQAECEALQEAEEVISKSNQA